MIYEYLSEGAENAKTGREICGLLGITIRDLTLAIEAERRAGHPICASTGTPAGYFLAANRQEMEKYCRSLHRRAAEIYKTRAACARMMDTLPEGEAG